MNQPEIEITENTFRISLPNRNRIRESASRIGVVSESRVLYGKPDRIALRIAPRNAPQITPQMQMVLDYLSQHETVTDEGLADLLGVKRTRAYLIARQMSEMGLLRSTGRGRTKLYLLASF